MHPTEDDLILHFYRETASDEAARVERHMAGCSRCRDEYARLQRVMAMVDAQPAAEAPPGFERVMWARVEPHVAEPRRSSWPAWFTMPRLALVGGMAAMVVAAFVAGRLSNPSAPEPAQVAVGGSRPALAADVSPERVLLTAAGDHLERSQIILVELLNAEAVADVAGERERAADLVAEGRLIRQSATQAGEAAITDVLEDLERVLQEIANGPDEATAQELQSLREQIESRGILFRVRVMSSEMRERERVERRGPPVS
jgi:anti-sigma factor ChrR (cupin superfamily)